MTRHEILVGDSRNMESVADGGVNLIVTSPPYPMIEMWDGMFANQDPAIGEALQMRDGMTAFRGMHAVLDSVWKECDRVLADGGFVCINIGDATRTMGDRFMLYPNHVRIIEAFLEMGYSVLPDIHWHKQSNAPNKFMGSGMYPAGAYVTYEHEYILIFRKGGKRTFDGADRERRRKSAFFWEERNVWFSDLWDIKGASQVLPAAGAARKRNASFPLEIPLRLINMYSVRDDVVLDPFVGLGTTCLAGMIAGRSSIGYEIDENIADSALGELDQDAETLNVYIDERIKRHLAFMESLPNDRKRGCYRNIPHGFAVRTRQETAIEIMKLEKVERSGNSYVCKYGQLKAEMS